MTRMYYDMNANHAYTLEEMKDIHQTMLSHGLCTEPNFISWLEVQQEVNYFVEDHEWDELPFKSNRESSFER